MEGESRQSGGFVRSYFKAFVGIAHFVSIVLHDTVRHINDDGHFLQDERANLIFQRVTQMTAPPTELFDPWIVSKIIWQAIRNNFAGTK